LHVELQNLEIKKARANNAKPGNTKTKKNKLIANIVPMAIMANAMFLNAKTMVGKNQMIAMRVVSFLMIPWSTLKTGLAYLVRPVVFVKNFQKSATKRVFSHNQNIGGKLCLIYDKK